MSMAREAWETIVAYRLVWLKAVFFILSPAIAQFLAIQQTVDMDTKWATMGVFARSAFWLGIISPAIGALMAFGDNSVHNAKEAKEGMARKRTGHTEFLNRPDTGP